jgi:hypothetical protein
MNLDVVGLPTKGMNADFLLTLVHISRFRTTEEYKQHIPCV